MKARTLVGGIFALIWLMALPAWAVEYRLEVTNLDDQVFSSYEGSGTSWWSQNEAMGRLEARLDQQQFSPAAVLPGHHVELLEDPAYGGTVPTRVSLLPATEPAGLDHVRLRRQPGGYRRLRGEDRHDRLAGGHGCGGELIMARSGGCPSADPGSLGLAGGAGGLAGLSRQCRRSRDVSAVCGAACQSGRWHVPHSG